MPRQVSLSPHTGANPGAPTDAPDAWLLPYPQHALSPSILGSSSGSGGGEARKLRGFAAELRSSVEFDSLCGTKSTLGGMRGDPSSDASFAGVALLPSEATLRFSRALYLRDVPGVTKAHAKLI